MTATRSATGNIRMTVSQGMPAPDGGGPPPVGRADSPATTGSAFDVADPVFDSTVLAGVGVAADVDPAPTEAAGERPDVDAAPAAAVGVGSDIDATFGAEVGVGLGTVDIGVGLGCAAACTTTLPTIFPSAIFRSMAEGSESLRGAWMEQ